jgi:hypothetical protein
VPRVERKTECHKLKDDQIIELLILVSEIRRHSNSFNDSDSRGGTIDNVNNLHHQTYCSRSRRKVKPIISLAGDVLSPNFTNK